MKPVDPIAAVERQLGRLVPVPLSHRAARDLDELIDTLAASRNPRLRTTTPWRALALTSAAAVVVGALSGWLAMAARPPARPATDARRPVPAAPGIELVGLTNRLGEAEDGGILADDDGTVHQVLLYHGVEEQLVRDARSGVTVRVTEPREEMVLVPVSSF